MIKSTFQYTLYKIIACLYLFFRIFSSTYLIRFITDLSKLESIVNYTCCLGLFFVFIRQNKIKTKKVFLSIIILLVTLIASRNSSDKAIIITCLFIIAYPSGLEIKKLAKSLFQVSMLTVFTTVACMFFKFIPDYISVQHGVARHSLGFVAPNAIANIITLNIMLWYFYNDSKKTIKSGIVIFAFLTIVYLFTNSRLAYLIGIIDIMINIYLDNKKSTKIDKKIFFISKYIISFFSVLCIFMTLFFSKNTSLSSYSLIDNLSTGRLSWMINYYNNYGIGLWGNKIVSVAKITAVTTGGRWFNLDNSYILFSIKYGVVFLLVFIVLYNMLGNFMRKNGNIKSAIYVILIASFGMTESILFTPGFNFSLMFIAEMLSGTKQNEDKKT